MIQKKLAGGSSVRQELFSWGDFGVPIGLLAAISLDAAADHGVSEALQPRDPSGDGEELNWTGHRNSVRARSMRASRCSTRRLDLRSLLAKAGKTFPTSASLGPRDL